MQLVPMVTGQINQGFGWQNWGRIIITGIEGKEFKGCWETGVMSSWYRGSGSEARTKGMSRIAPDDHAALLAYFAQEPPHV